MDISGSKSTLILIVIAGFLLGVLLANYGEVVDNYETTMESLDSEKETVESFEDNLILNNDSFNQAQAQLNGKNLTYYRGIIQRSDETNNWSSNGRYISHPYWLNGTDGRFNRNGTDHGLVILLPGETLSKDIALAPGEYSLEIEAANVAKLSRIYSESRVCQELNLGVHKDEVKLKEWQISNQDRYKTFTAEFTKEPSSKILGGVENTDFRFENTDNDECEGKVQYIGINRVSIDKK